MTQIRLVLRIIGNDSASIPNIGIVNLFCDEREFGVFQTDDIDAVYELAAVLDAYVAKAT